MKTKPTEKHQACTKCKGTGEMHRDALPAGTYGGTYYPAVPARTDPCCYCHGAGWFAPLDVPAICEEIKGRKGLRSARPKSSRAYYVWRLARFHGGADVTMPVCAMLDINGDPFEKQLELLADAVAKKVFGTDLAAACRWGNALGHNITVPDNMPPSAYSCGPVADADKPESEQMELA